MGRKFYFKDLKIWQKGVDLTDGIYTVTEKFPRDQQYVLSNQMQRSALSIPSNIAEGNVRKSTKEFERFLNIANGSCAELLTQLVVAKRRSYISEESYIKLEAAAEEISRMILGLIGSLRGN